MYSRYRWTRNDVALVVDGVKIKQEANAGTLVLPEPTEDDAGWYQCLAENSYGVAVSIKTELKPACKYDATLDGSRQLRDGRSKPAGIRPDIFSQTAYSYSDTGFRFFKPL